LLQDVDFEELSPRGRTFLRRILRSLSDLHLLPDDEADGRLERTHKAVLTRWRQGPDPGPGTVAAPKRHMDAPARDRSSDAATPITGLRGVGPVTADSLATIGIHTVADLLHHLPRTYQDRSSATPIGSLEAGAYAVVVGNVDKVRSGRGRRVRFLEITLSDETGTLLATWFRPPPYLFRAFTADTEVVLMGRVEKKGSTLRMNHAEFETAERADGQDEARGSGDGLHSGIVVPIYSLPSGLGQRGLRKLVHRALSDFAEGVPDRVPGDLRAQLGLPTRAEALAALHFPEGPEDLPVLRAGKHPAHEALLWEDLFILQVALLRRRWALRQRGCAAQAVASSDGGVSLRDRLVAALPFELTSAQVRVLAELDGDLQDAQPMQRLLQGDVGSGKTIVALLAAAPLLESGQQVAVLAPTEVLAFQWWERARELLEPLGFSVALLTGGQGAAARRHNRSMAAEGRAVLIVGTHALFQEGVSFRNLAMAVVDEQQRFGVFQRARLLDKGASPHLLAMTATPIPRSLALTLYGDLDVTTLDERPPRGQVTTAVWPEARRDAIYQAVRAVAERGERVYVICPRVEGAGEGRAAVDTADELREGVLQGVPMDVLHGRMDPASKDRVLERFRDGRIAVLVSTTVVEVGVDVPEATLIVIEDAYRFGLAQLHQLRGRVGRSGRGGRCLLVTDRETERLRILEDIDDGFKLAEEDLRLRGPGDLVGSRQAGAPSFRLSTTPRFLFLLHEARDAARDVVERPDYETQDELAPLRAAVAVRLEESAVTQAG